jgi:hypothetical protein
MNGRRLLSVAQCNRVNTLLVFFFFKNLELLLDFDISGKNVTPGKTSLQWKVKK